MGGTRRADGAVPSSRADGRRFPPAGGFACVITDMIAVTSTRLPGEAQSTSLRSTVIMIERGISPVGTDSGASCSFHVCWSTYWHLSGSTTYGSTPKGREGGGSAVGAGRRGRLAPRRASKLLRRRAGVRGRAPGPGSHLSGGWGAVLTQGGGRSSPAAPPHGGSLGCRTRSHTRGSCAPAKPARTGTCAGIAGSRGGAKARFPPRAAVARGQ